MQLSSNWYLKQIGFGIKALAPTVRFQFDLGLWAIMTYGYTTPSGQARRFFIT